MTNSVFLSCCNSLAHSRGQAGYLTDLPIRMPTVTGKEQEPSIGFTLSTLNIPLLIARPHSIAFSSYFFVVYFLASSLLPLTAKYVLSNKVFLRKHQFIKLSGCELISSSIFFYWGGRTGNFLTPAPRCSEIGVVKQWDAWQD